MQDEPIVLTEAEKDILKRKRQSEAQPQVEELSEECGMCGNIFCECEPTQQRRHLDEEEEDIEEDEAEGEADEEDDIVDDLPDLHQYFEGFEIEPEKIISMCRAYASYLVSLKPRKIIKRLKTCLSKEDSPPSQKPRYWEAKKRRK